MARMTARPTRRTGPRERARKERRRILPPTSSSLRWDKPGGDPRRVLCGAGQSGSHGEAAPPRHGAADRGRAHDDPIRARGFRGPPPPPGPGPSVRGVGASDRDAIQRPRPRTVQALVLQEVPRVPPAVRELAGAGLSEPGRGHMLRVWRDPEVPVPAGAEGAARPAPRPVGGRAILLFPP